MRKIMSVVVACLCMAGCKEQQLYDAMGRFESTEVVVSAETTGKLMALNVEEGCRVEEGQLLAEVDSVQLFLQFRQVKAQLDALLRTRPDVKKQVSALKEQLAKAQLEEKRFAHLLEDHAATQKQYDDVEATIRILQGQLDATLSNLSNHTASINSNAVALEVRMAQLEDQMRRCKVKAPIRGTVLVNYAEKGELVTVGRPLMKLANLDQVFLRAYFTSEQLAQVNLGDEVKVVADFGADQRYDYIGKVQWIASESEFTPKSIQTKNTRANLVYAVKIAVPNDGRIKLGLYGEVFL